MTVPIAMGGGHDHGRYRHDRGDFGPNMLRGSSQEDGFHAYCASSQRGEPVMIPFASQCGLGQDLAIQPPG